MSKQNSLVLGSKLHFVRCSLSADFPNGLTGKSKLQGFPLLLKFGRQYIIRKIIHYTKWNQICFSFVHDYIPTENATACKTVDTDQTIKRSLARNTTVFSPHQ